MIGANDVTGASMGGARSSSHEAHCGRGVVRKASLISSEALLETRYSDFARDDPQTVLVFQGTEKMW